MNELTFLELRERSLFQLEHMLLAVVGKDKSKWKDFDSYFLREEYAKLRSKLIGSGVDFNEVNFINAFYSAVYLIEYAEDIRSLSLVANRYQLLKYLKAELARVVEFEPRYPVEVVLSYYKRSKIGELEDKTRIVEASSLVTILKRDPLSCNNLTYSMKR